MKPHPLSAHGNHHLCGAPILLPPQDWDWAAQALAGVERQQKSPHNTRASIQTSQNEWEGTKYGRTQALQEFGWHFIAGEDGNNFQQLPKTGTWGPSSAGFRSCRSESGAKMSRRSRAWGSRSCCVWCDGWDVSKGGWHWDMGAGFEGDRYQG